MIRSPCHGWVYGQRANATVFYFLGINVLLRIRNFCKTLLMPNVDGFNVSIEEGCKNNSKIPCDSTFYYVTYVAEQKSKSN